MFSLLQPGFGAVFMSLSCCPGNRQNLGVRESLRIFESTNMMYKHMGPHSSGIGKIRGQVRRIQGISWQEWDTLFIKMLHCMQKLKRMTKINKTKGNQRVFVKRLTYRNA